MQSRQYPVPCRPENTVDRNKIRPSTPCRTHTLLYFARSRSRTRETLQTWETSRDPHFDVCGRSHVKYTSLPFPATSGHEIYYPPLLEMDQASNNLGASGERHPLLSLISACFWVIRECFIRASEVRHWTGLIETNLFRKSGC